MRLCVQRVPHSPEEPPQAVRQARGQELEGQEESLPAQAKSLEQVVSSAVLVEQRLVAPPAVPSAEASAGLAVPVVPVVPAVQEEEVAKERERQQVPPQVPTT